MTRVYSARCPASLFMAARYLRTGPWITLVRCLPPKLATNRWTEDTLTEVQHRPAILALEDGHIFNGRAAGALTRRGGEVVFNTSLTGYQEVFTDPSYAGQIVCLTYPHIGNVGANADDEESGRPYIEALAVREFSALASNWRSHESAHQYLERHGVPVIWGIDTRALVLHLRQVGALRGVLSTDETPAEQLIAEARALPTMTGQELASRVTVAQRYAWTQGSINLAQPLAGAVGAVSNPKRGIVKGNGRAANQIVEDATQALAPRGASYRIVAYDFGIKRNILRLLVDLGGQVMVVPAQT